MVYKYHLVKAEDRKKTDLKKNYGNAIRNAVEDFFRDDLIYVKVFKRYYAFKVSCPVTNGMLRSLGRKISHKIFDKDKLLVKHKYNSRKTGKPQLSRKRFIRKK